jgi:hypothetical protein
MENATGSVPAENKANFRLDADREIGVPGGPAMRNKANSSIADCGFRPPVGAGGDMIADWMRSCRRTLALRLPSPACRGRNVQNEPNLADRAGLGEQNAQNEANLPRPERDADERKMQNEPNSGPCPVGWGLGDAGRGFPLGARPSGLRPSARRLCKTKPILQGPGLERGRRRFPFPGDRSSSILRGVTEWWAQPTLRLYLRAGRCRDQSGPMSSMENGE